VIFAPQRHLEVIFTIAYDSVNHVFFGGAQDNGVPEQTAPDQYTAIIELPGDGGQAAADNTSQTGFSLHYSTFNGNGNIYEKVFTDKNQQTTTTTLPLIVNGSGGQSVFQVDANAGLPRFILNAVDPTKMLVSTGGGFLFESTSPVAGDTLDNLGQIGRVGQPSPLSFVSTWAYGGTAGGVTSPGIIYFGSGPTLLVRTSGSGPPVAQGTYPGGSIQGIALDPNDWYRAYVVDASGRVWLTTDAAATLAGWTELTGTAGSGTDLRRLSNDLRKIVVVAHPGIPGRQAVLVGGRGGVFGTLDPNAGPNTAWSRIGDNFPNVIVNDMVYDRIDDVLLAGTYGRGAWKLPSAASSLLLSAGQCVPGTTCGSCGTGFCVDHCDGQAVIGELCVTSTVGPGHHGRTWPVQRALGGAGRPCKVTDPG
jgi:hypothetical protein